jgi:hypothetical protein
MQLAAMWAVLFALKKKSVSPKPDKLLFIFREREKEGVGMKAKRSLRGRELYFVRGVNAQLLGERKIRAPFEAPLLLFR